MTLQLLHRLRFDSKINETEMCIHLDWEPAMDANFATDWGRDTYARTLSNIGSGYLSSLEADEHQQK